MGLLYGAERTFLHSVSPFIGGFNDTRGVNSAVIVCPHYRQHLTPRFVRVGGFLFCVLGRKVGL